MWHDSHDSYIIDILSKVGSPEHEGTEHVTTPSISDFYIDIECHRSSLFYYAEKSIFKGIDFWQRQLKK